MFRTEERESDIVIVRGEGRLNMVSAAELRDTISDAVASGRRRVVVDLSQIGFMDSSGLGALIGSLKVARAAGGDLRIAQPSDQVQMVLELSNVDRILKSHAEPETAYVD